MNLLFLTGANVGESLVVNVDRLDTISVFSEGGKTVLRILRKGLENGAQFDVVETPAAICAQLLRMAHPFVAVEPGRELDFKLPQTFTADSPPTSTFIPADKPAPFVCPKCGGTIRVAGHRAEICITCQTISQFHYEPPHWRPVA